MSERIEKAFQSVGRANFIPDSVRDMSELDRPLPIGYEQTISQPTTVRLMLEWLDARPGHKILDIGSGSGWTTALLSSIVGTYGNIFAVELVPELVKFGKTNCLKSGIKNAKFYQATEEFGLADHAPFDRILVSAATGHVPLELLKQIKVGGKIVIPIKHDILEISKIASDNYKTERHPGFIFVPLKNPVNSH